MNILSSLRKSKMGLNILLNLVISSAYLKASIFILFIPVKKLVIIEKYKGQYNWLFLSPASFSSMNLFVNFSRQTNISFRLVIFTLFIICSITEKNEYNLILSIKFINEWNSFWKKKFIPWLNILFFSSVYLHK